MLSHASDQAPLLPSWEPKGPVPTFPGEQQPVLLHAPPAPCLGSPAARA
jgi:hypothetical protein